MEAVKVQEGGVVDYTAVAAVVWGDMVKLPNGLAGVIQGSVAAGAVVGAAVRGYYKLPKTALIALLAGGDAYWDVSAKAVHFRPEAGTNDYYIGTIAADAVAADTEVVVMLNGRAHYAIDLSRGDEFTASSLAGSTGTRLNLIGGIAQLVVANTSEAQQQGFISNHSVPASSKGITEFRVAVYDLGSSVIDLDFGIMNALHASDFELATAFAAFHMDGADANIDTHSDDNVTDRAPADSTYDWVDDTYAEYWVDWRDDTNIKYYVEGLLVDTSSSLRTLTAALTTAMKTGLMVEKSIATETSEIRCSRARTRINVE